jgi:hypothetical protein
MRILLAAAILAGALGAQERENKKDFKLEDSFWGVAYTTPGLKKLLALGDPGLIFRGKAGDLAIAIRVYESETEKPVKSWLEEAKRKRFAKGVDLIAGPAWVRYKRTSLAGFHEHHQHSFFARGHHCFELHVRADREDATASLEAAATGFELAKQAPGTLLVARIARERGRPLDDPGVLLEAGGAYVTGKYRMTIPALAQRVLKHARKTMKPDSYEPDQLWRLYEFGGLALHDDAPLESMEWHARAEEAADKLQANRAESKRKSAYNLACAASLAKRIDEAFAALYRAYDGGKPVTDSHVSADRDLENLRRDERWHAFWREKVRG